MLRNLSICAGLVLLQATLVAEANGQDKRLVGELSDLSRTEIRGVRTFPAERVREALGKDSEAILASHPLAPLDDLPSVVSQRLKAGFQRVGFADADVRTEIDVDDSRLIATVTEGPRFLNGSVRIDNATQIDADRLKQRLTQRYAPREAITPVFDEADPGRVARWLDKDDKDVDWSDPVWKADTPARMDTGSQAMYQRQVSHALEDLGFRDAEFDVALESNREARRVDLVVRLRDEGSPAEIERIEVHGNDRDSAEAIVDYLDLAVGMLMTRRRETQVRYDVWRSGRFLSSEVEVQRPEGEGGYNLLLTVTDSPYAPPIDQPLSKEEEAVRKMGRWLAKADAWHGDMVFSAKGESNSVTAIVAAQDGLLMSLYSLDADATRPMTLVGSCREIACYPSRSDARLQTGAPDVVLTLNLAYRLNDDPEEPEKPVSINFGFGFKSKEEDDTAPPFRIEFQVTPAACLAIADARDAKSTWEGERLIIESVKERFEIDGRDGRLIRYTNGSPESEVAIAFEDNAFAEALEAAHRSAGDGENLFDPRRPLRSTFDFLLREEVLNEWAALMQSLAEKELTPRERRLLSLWAKVISMGVLEPIDEQLTKSKPKDDSDDKFIIPDAAPDTPGSWIQGLAWAIVPLSDELFPRGSWPWTVWRETGFFVAGKRRYTGQQLQHIYKSDDFGPVGILVAASLLNRTNERAAHTLARRGTWYMSVDDFRKDYLPLLDDARLTGKCLRRACEILRALSDNELHELAAWLPGQWRAAFYAFSNALRRDADRPLDEAIPASLDIAWEAGLRTMIEKMLTDIHDRGGLRLSRR